MNIQREFYAAGCDAVDSATFGANKIVFAEYGIEERVEEQWAQGQNYLLYLMLITTL